MTTGEMFRENPSGDPSVPAAFPPPHRDPVPTERKVPTPAPRCGREDTWAGWEGGTGGTAPQGWCSPAGLIV